MGKLMKTDRWTALAASAVLLTSLALVAAAHIGVSAWADEAWEVEYARQPTAAATLRTALHEGQPAAPGYLLLLHAVSRIDGRHLWAYRLPSAVFAAAAFFLVAHLLGRCCGSRPLGFAGALLLLAMPLLQRYTVEIKQYMAEVAFTVALIALADAWARTRQRAAGWAWGATALLALVTGFATWFAVAGTAVVLAGVWLRRRGWKELRLLAVGLSVLALLAGAIHFYYSRYLFGNPVTQSFWADQFLTFRADLPLQVWRLSTNLLSQAWLPHVPPVHLVLALGPLMWLAWWWRQPTAALAALLTVAVTLGASLAHLWPLGPRINIPLTVILHVTLMAGGLSLMAAVLDRLSRWRIHATPADDAAIAAPVSTTELASASTPATGATTRGLAGLGLAAALLLAPPLLWVSFHTNYEVTGMGELLDQMERIVAFDKPDTVVLMDSGAHLNQQFRQAGAPEPRGAPGFHVERLAWPEGRTIIDAALPAVGDPHPVWIAVGLHNQEIREGYERMREQLRPLGQLAGPIWEVRDRMVAIYRFEPVAGIRAQAGAIDLDKICISSPGSILR
jgi:hypothetical protein